MNVLLFVDGDYFQLMLAIHIKTTILKENNVDLFLRVYNKESTELILKKLEAENLFNKIQIMDDPYNLTNKPELDKKFLLKLKCILFPKKILHETGIQVNTLNYNSFISMTLWFPLDRVLFATIKRKNAGCKCYCVAEVLAWSSPFIKKNDFLDKLANFLHYPKVEQHFCGTYLLPTSIPENEIFPLIEIPSPDENSDLFPLLNRIWNYQQIEIVKEKYIFLTDSFASLKDDDIVEVALNVAEIVGKNNMIVKLHPRSKDKERFLENGFKLFPKCEFPFELYLKNNDCSNKILIARYTSSVLSGYIWGAKEPLKLFIYYKCTYHLKMFWYHISKHIYKIDKKFYPLGNSRIECPNTFEEFYDMLRKIS
jgi:hypothetical protein